MQIKMLPNVQPHGLCTHIVHFISKQGWHADGFELRSPVVQRTFGPKNITSIVYMHDGVYYTPVITFGARTTYDLV